MTKVQNEAHAEYYLSSSMKLQETVEKVTEELMTIFAELSHQSACEVLQSFVKKLQYILIANCLPEEVSKFYELHKITVNCCDAKGEKVIGAGERAVEASYGKSNDERAKDKFYADKFRKRIVDFVAKFDDNFHAELLSSYDHAMQLCLENSV
ncbi:hypothetical protein EON65_36340 [archaeon]|nr:MAG: hypothetical protein EON65_36340 [archaeon]